VCVELKLGVMKIAEFKRLAKPLVTLLSWRGVQALLGELSSLGLVAAEL